LMINGSAEEIRALQGVMPPQDFNALKAAYLNKRLSDSDGVVNFGTSLNALARDQKSVLILGEEESKEIADLLSLGKRVGSPIVGAGSGAAETLIQGIFNAARDISAEATLEASKVAARARNAKEASRAINTLPAKGGKAIRDLSKQPQRVVDKFLQEQPFRLRSPLRTLIEAARLESIQEKNRQQGELNE